VTHSQNHLGFGLRSLGLGAFIALLSACSTPDLSTQSGVPDPYEGANRAVHDVNLSLDRNIVRPVSLGYTNVMPDGIEDNINNLSDNLGVPSTMINQVLQGDFAGATRNLLRFSINTTLGIVGLADVAAGLGLEKQEADFGQTLAVWGVPQGNYVVIPFVGPSTERAAVGLVVDILLNPLSGRLYPDPALPPPLDLYATSARVASVASQRGRFSTTIDSVLYESADSYEASRDVYLQNRAFELEQVGVSSAASSDPYADILGGADDPYADLFGE